MTISLLHIRCTLLTACHAVFTRRRLLIRKAAIQFSFILAASLAAHADSVSTFSSGFVLPETISVAPAGYGSYAGQLVVEDVGNTSGDLNGPGAIYAVSTAGGSPTLIASGIQAYLVGGTFAPANYGAISGDYIAAGTNSSASAAAVAYAITSSGQVTLFSSNTTNGAAEYGQPIIAPAGFGAAAGNLLVPILNNSGTQVAILNSNGSTTNLGNAFTALGFGYGTVFAPNGFGSVGGMLLISDTESGQIIAVDSNGNEHPFTTIALGPSQTGLRQMAFAPAGFGSYGGDLLVSISGSSSGGGIAGEIAVLDGNGNIIAILQEGVDGAPFDPRGLYFENSSDLLVADSDPSILSVPPSAFTAVPEPASIWLCAAGTVFAAFSLRRRKLQERFNG